MSRRQDLEPRFQLWLRDLGACVQGVRCERGWTQPQAAERLGLDYKHFQAIEYGRARISAHTLFVLAAGLGVDPSALLPRPGRDGDAESIPSDSGSWRALRAAGWRVLPASEEVRPGRSVPVYDLQAAAGPAVAEARVPAIVGWANPPAARRAEADELFVVRASGTSMKPLIMDGDWCLFRQPAAPPLLGRIVLIRLSEDAEAGRFQIKRVGALAVGEDGLGVLVRLDSLNRDMAPVYVQAASEGEILALGELVEVVGTRAVTRKSPEKQEF